MIPPIYDWHPCRVCGYPVPAGQPAHRECEHCETWQNDDPDDYCPGPQNVTCASCGARVCALHAWAHDGRYICAVCYGIAGYQRLADVLAASERDGGG